MLTRKDAKIESNDGSFNDSSVTFKLISHNCNGEGNESVLQGKEWF